MFPFDTSYIDAIKAAFVHQVRAGEKTDGTVAIMKTIGLTDEDIEILSVLALTETPSEQILSSTEPAREAKVQYLRHLDDCTCIVCSKRRPSFSDYLKRVKN